MSFFSFITSLTCLILIIFTMIMLNGFIEYSMCRESGLDMSYCYETSNIGDSLSANTRKQIEKYIQESE